MKSNKFILRRGHKKIEYNIHIYYLYKIFNKFLNDIFINPLTSPSAGTPSHKYGDVNTETTSPGEVKGLIRYYCIPINNHQKKITKFKLFLI